MRARPMLLWRKGRANSESVSGGSNFAFADLLRKSVRSSEPDVLPELLDAAFEQWPDNAKSPKCTTTRLDGSVWARGDVLPSVVFCGGVGGVSAEANVRRDGKCEITALVIECGPEVCQTRRRLNSPSVPVLQQRTVNANETKRAVARFLPRSHWRGAWFQSPSSCKKASTAHMAGRRDTGAALSDATFRIQMIRKLGPAIWTLGHASELHQFARRGKCHTAIFFSSKAALPVPCDVPDAACCHCFLGWPSSWHLRFTSRPWRGLRPTWLCGSFFFARVVKFRQSVLDSQRKGKRRGQGRGRRSGRGNGKWKRHGKGRWRGRERGRGRGKGNRKWHGNGRWGGCESESGSGSRSERTFGSNRSGKCAWRTPQEADLRRAALV